MLTDMKQTGVPNRTPFSAAQGGASGTRPRVQMTSPVQTGNAGLTRPVMSNQDAAASRVGAVPTAPQQNPLLQNLPLSAAKPFDQTGQMAGSGGTTPFQLPMNPNATPATQSLGYGTWPSDPNAQLPKVRDNFRASSAKGGPTPLSHIETGPWWENGSGAQTPASAEGTMLGPWATENAPLSAQGTAPNQNYDPSMVVRNALSQMKNSEIAQILMEVANGKLRGRSE